MDERDWLAERFEEHRTHLEAVAYRMLGSLSEADDAVQEAWLRLGRSDADEIEDLGGWLTTVVARVSLNMLRSRKRRREEPMDLRMPEPIVDRGDGTDPEHEALLADSVGLALLVVLETLTPAERLAFVLHDMFAHAASTRSRRSSTAHRRRRASSRTGHATGSGARAPSPMRTWTLSARSSTRSSRPRARATSSGWSRCSTRTSCSRGDFGGRRAIAGNSVGPRRSPPTRSCSRGSGWRCGRRSSTAPSGPSRCATDKPFSIGAVTVRDGKIVELDFLADPERLAQLDLTILDG